MSFLDKKNFDADALMMSDDDNNSGSDGVESNGQYQKTDQ